MRGYPREAVVKKHKQKPLFEWLFQLTLLEIQALPVTLACPAEERC